MRMNDEGSSQCQKNVRPVQGNTPSRCGTGDMLEPQAQAEAGMMKASFRLQAAGFRGVMMGHTNTYNLISNTSSEGGA